MKTIFFQCNMGAAGDMISAALVGLLDNPLEYIDEFNSLKLPGVTMTLESAVKCGIKGNYISVKVDGVEELEAINHREAAENLSNHRHIHRNLSDIEKIIEFLNVSDKVKQDVKNIYHIIAEAESTVHGETVENIHFHEVGSLDAIADVVSACLLIEKIAPDKIITSPICVGSGQVKCAHGTLPVPAPATELILQGVPIYSGNINSELCTPTGAAILKYFTDEYGEMPQITVSKCGYGMGKKDFEVANCVRCLLGETKEFIEDKTKKCENNKSSLSENVTELCCNIDDMTAEELAFAAEALLEKGALDVYTIPIGMKKSRAATMLVCMCRQSEKDKFLKLIFKYTTTLGVREYNSVRHFLNREIVEEETKFGTVRVKKAEGYGVSHSKIEFEDLKKIALENDCSIMQARENYYRKFI